MERDFRVVDQDVRFFFFIKKSFGISTMLSQEEEKGPYLSGAALLSQHISESLDGIA